MAACVDGREPGHIILVGDAGPGGKVWVKCYEGVMPEGWKIHHVVIKGLAEGGENYKEHAQLLIARMRTEAFSAARKLGVDLCWSLDSDTLPPANALRCMETMLEFDDGYYSVSTCPYPNSAFLGGRGTPQNPIAEDYLPSERKLPSRLKAAWDACNSRIANAPTEKEHKRRERLAKRIRDCPPDGNVWEVIAKHGWRRRGWLDSAYPGIGRGAVVPSDWCGFGCTLMNRKALALACFDGYDGKGTEDLFIVWKRWHPAGLRINVITHCPCDHVIWEKKKGGDAGKFTLISAFHETEGEYVGHLRTSQTPWIR